MHHQHTSLLHHPLAPTCTANLTLQLPAPSQPLGRVWQGDSDTYRHVTRATRVSPLLTPARTQRQFPGLAGAQLQQHLPHEGRAGPLPPPWGGTCPLLLHAMEASGHGSKWPQEQVATGASGQGSKWPRTPLPTSPSRDTFPEPWGQDRRGDARGSGGSAGDERAGWAAALGGNMCDWPKEQIPFS